MPVWGRMGRALCVFSSCHPKKGQPDRCRLQREQTGAMWKDAFSGGVPWAGREAARRAEDGTSHLPITLSSAPGHPALHSTVTKTSWHWEKCMSFCRLSVLQLCCFWFYSHVYTLLNFFASLLDSSTLSSVGWQMGENMNIPYSSNLEHIQPGSSLDLASHLKARTVFLTIQHPPSMKL